MNELVKAFKRKVIVYGISFRQVQDQLNLSLRMTVMQVLVKLHMIQHY